MDEITQVEALNAMRGVAKMSRAFYEQLIEEGFEVQQAMYLTGKWLYGMARTSQSSDE